MRLNISIYARLPLYCLFYQECSPVLKWEGTNLYMTLSPNALAQVFYLNLAKKEGGLAF